MFEILPLTPELLAELGDELGGCDFTDPSQIDFLAEAAPCDVQAAPGNGKTTLLAAKLALLSRNWTTRRRGVCVISHTNAARTEVEDLIARHPTAARLMTYPHFTGTVTAFINQYLALPYLRGLGWHVRQIDDDAFAAEALRRYPSWRVLDNLAKNQKLKLKRKLEEWIALLDLDPAFTDTSPEPSALAVRCRKGQWGAHTDCGKALESLKASMVKSGLYRYADMTALARRALLENPTLAARLRDRFPLVILDEAQDTHGDQLRLLEHVFKQDGAAFQRLGDSNQTLYEDEGTAPAYWTPGPGCIPLDTSRRFGGEIAGFASRLTARQAQTIVGLGARPASRVMFLFDEATIGGVLGAFADEARALWGGDCSTRDIWAVASRHNLVGKKGAWQPKSLVDYHPAYRSEGGSRSKANLFCRQLQKAAVHHAAARPPAEVSEMLAAGMSGLARAHGWKAANDRPITAHNVWAALAHRDVALPRIIRRLLRDHVLAGAAVWEEAAWLAFMEALLPLFNPPPQGSEGDIAEFCTFVAEQKADLADPERRSTKQVQFDDLILRLGSIHSVKGKSLDGILVVESEVWKGSSADEQCIDLTAVLPRAFGVTDELFTGVRLTAATNVFVGVTRPRELLGLALRKSEATVLIGPATDQGWKLVDLVAQAAELKE
ncbi:MULTISPECIES: UvrD-helicase domain-containing protein [Hyphomicrobiales]|uniref:UvrD-helicase domain-containing protein n=1 Tax=Hyphomicrobiales TaxID=356 RepID=UPI001A24305C|nr:MULTISPECIES: UvrD-helicase domain-containing protein [Hyphomicrobiales]MBJ7403048.1 UvrD-helicase domain-containing protein [Bradyrhizobium sp.]MBX3547058.1 UvrD-helicase domain-containing protein [Chelatococcus sp.]